MIMIVPCQSCLKINKVDLEKSKSAKAKCGSCKAYLPLHEGVQDLNGNTLKKLIANADVPVVVDFWANWCGPCKMFAPIFKAVAQDIGGRIIFAKFDTEQDFQASSAMRIQSIPTLIVFKNGIEIERQAGAKSQAELSAYLSRFL